MSNDTVPSDRMDSDMILDPETGTMQYFFRPHKLNSHCLFCIYDEMHDSDYVIVMMSWRGYDVIPFMTSSQ